MEISKIDSRVENVMSKEDAEKGDKARCSNACIVANSAHLNLNEVAGPSKTRKRLTKCRKIQQQGSDQLVDVVVLRKDDMISSIFNENSICDHFVISRQEYETLILRQNMEIWKLLRDTPFLFKLPEIINSTELGTATSPSPDDGALVKKNSLSASLRPLPSRKRKTRHVPRADFVDKAENDRLEKGKALIEKLPNSLVEKCDIVRTALFLTFCDIDSLAP